jgi:hypothetical protein
MCLPGLHILVNKQKTQHGLFRFERSARGLRFFPFLLLTTQPTRRRHRHHAFIGLLPHVHALWTEISSLRRAVHRVNLLPSIPSSLHAYPFCPGRTLNDNRPWNKKPLSFPSYPFLPLGIKFCLHCILRTSTWSISASKTRSTPKLISHPGNSAISAASSIRDLG